MKTHTPRVIGMGAALISGVALVTGYLLLKEPVLSRLLHNLLPSYVDNSEIFSFSKPCRSASEYINGNEAIAAYAIRTERIVMQTANGKIGEACFYYEHQRELPQGRPLHVFLFSWSNSSYLCVDIITQKDANGSGSGLEIMLDSWSGKPADEQTAKKLQEYYRVVQERVWLDGVRTP